MDLLRPMALDHVRDAVQLRLVHHEARVDCRGVGDDPEAQAGGAAAVRHRLPDVDDFDAADRPIAGDMAFDPAPHGRSVPRLADQFDYLLHFDETRAVEPLERSALWDAGELAETFPSGL